MAAGVDLSKTLAGGSEELFDTCCSPCLEDGKSVEADKYCVDCEMYFCKQCLKHHKKFPTTRAHNIVDKSGPDSDTENTRMAQPTERCLTHNRKLMDMYCGDHDVVCCSACIAVMHSNWDDGEPGGKEDCAVLYTSKIFPWHDYMCTRSFGFVCRKPARLCDCLAN